MPRLATSQIKQNYLLPKKLTDSVIQYMKYEHFFIAEGKSLQTDFFTSITQIELVLP